MIWLAAVALLIACFVVPRLGKAVLVTVLVGAGLLIVAAGAFWSWEKSQQSLRASRDAQARTVIQTTEVQFVDLRMASPEGGGSTWINGRIRNNSAAYTLTGVKIQVELLDCPVGGCDDASTETIGTDTVSINTPIPPGQSRDLYELVSFRSFSQFRGKFGWRYHALEIKGEPIQGSVGTHSENWDAAVGLGFVFAIGWAGGFVWRRSYPRGDKAKATEKAEQEARAAEDATFWRSVSAETDRGEALKKEAEWFRKREWVNASSEDGLMHRTTNNMVVAWCSHRSRWEALDPSASVKVTSFWNGAQWIYIEWAHVDAAEAYCRAIVSQNSLALSGEVLGEYRTAEEVLNILQVARPEISASSVEQAISSQRRAQVGLSQVC